MQSFVTTLPESVNDPELIGLNSVKISASVNDENLHSFIIRKSADDKDCKVRIFGDGVLCDEYGNELGVDAVDISGTSNNTIYFKGSGDVFFELTNRSYINLLNTQGSIFNYSLESIKYLKLTALLLNSSNVSGDVKALGGMPISNANFYVATGVSGYIKDMNSALKYISLQGSRVVLDSEGMNKMTAMESLTCDVKYEAFKGNVIFDLDDVNANTNLVNLYVPYCNGLTGTTTQLGAKFRNLNVCNLTETNITGTAAEFKAAAEAAGRHSGTCTFRDKYDTQTIITFT